MKRRNLVFPVLLAVLFVMAALLSWSNLTHTLPRAQWGQAFWQPDQDIIQQMLFHYSMLPRLVISLLVGAGLGLVGVLLSLIHI